MASTSTVSLALPVTKIGQRSPRSDAFFRPLRLPVTKIGQRSPKSDAFFQPLRLSVKPNLRANNGVVRLEVKASGTIKEHLLAGLATAPIVAALVIPEIAEASQPGVSPSLKNFLLSIASGGLVVGVIIGAVVAVANFDPVKRR